MKTNALGKTPLTPGVCEWCGKNCEMEDVACSLSCEAQLHRVEAVQGRMVLRTLKRWRKHRGAKGSPGEGAITEVAQIVDTFLRTDRQRREAHQAQQRREAQQTTTAAAAPKPTRKAAVPRSTAAPVVDEPDWRDSSLKTETGYNG